MSIKLLAALVAVVIIICMNIIIRHGLHKHDS